MAAVILAAMVPAAALAASGAPSVEAERTRPHSGERIRVVGAGFEPHERVAVLIGPPRSEAQRLGGTRAASDGSFEKRVRIPRGMTGPAVLLGCQRSCRIKDTQRIRILP